jgi:hypothetical protein
MRESLDNALSKHGKPVRVAALYNKLNASMRRVSEVPTLVGDAGESATRIYKMFKKKLQEAAARNDGFINPDELMQIRRDLDSELDIFKNKTGTTLSAREVAGKEIRDTLNQVVSEAAPDVDVMGMLDKHHKLLVAQELLHTRMGQEARTAVGRFIEGFERASGFKHPTTPVAFSTTVQNVGVAATALLGAVVYGTADKIPTASLAALRTAIEAPQYGLKAAEKASILALIEEYRASQKEQEQQ